MLVQKNGGIAGQTVIFVLLDQKSVDGEVVAEDARSAFRALAALGDLSSRQLVLADSAKKIELNSGLESFRPLVSCNDLKE